MGNPLNGLLNGLLICLQTPLGAIYEHPELERSKLPGWVRSTSTAYLVHWICRAVGGTLGQHSQGLTTLPHI